MKQRSTRKMQNVSFKAVDDFLVFLPDDELAMTEKLRGFVLESVPGIKEKLSFNVPFYSRNRGLFFIWPGSVFWGDKRVYDGVRFGFQYGHLLTDETGYLDKGNRKQVYYRDFKSLREIDLDQLERFILEAVLIDDEVLKTGLRPGK